MKNAFFLFLLFASLAFPQAVVINPYCKIPFSVSAAAAPVRVPAAGFNNKVLQCNTWVMSFQAPTSTTVISLRLESASDDVAGVAGSWGAFSGSTVSGSNPLTTLPNSTFIGQGNPAWVSVRLTSATGTGTVTGAAYGWYTPPQVFTSAGGGSIAANVTIVGPLGQAAMASSVPVAIASNQSAVTVGGAVSSGSADSGNPVKIGGSNGTNDYNLFVDSQGNIHNFLGCGSVATVALSGTGLTEIVAGTASQTIRVCKIFVTSATGGAPVVNTFSISRATVTSCASPTVVAAPTSVTGFDLDFGGVPLTAAGQSICISESVANSDVVTITYTKAIF